MEKNQTLSQLVSSVHHLSCHVGQTSEDEKDDSHVNFVSMQCGIWICF